MSRTSSVIRSRTCSAGSSSQQGSGEIDSVSVEANWPGSIASRRFRAQYSAVRSTQVPETVPSPSRAWTLVAPGQSWGRATSFSLQPCSSR